jgi:hypothetical protein
MLSVVMLSIVMLSVIMLCVVMLNVVMLHVVMLSVVAPLEWPARDKHSKLVYTPVKSFIVQARGVSVTKKGALNGGSTCQTFSPALCWRRTSRSSIQPPTA